MTTYYLLDTNVISESRRKAPNARVMQFLESLRKDKQEDVAFTSIVVIAELRKGAAQRAFREPEAGADLHAWVDRLEKNMEGRVIPIDSRVAILWGEFQSDKDRPAIDMLIAATAAAYGLTLVTRNVRDFDGLPVQILNPWAPV